MNARRSAFAWRLERLEPRLMCSASSLPHYDMGAPTLSDIWVDAASGDDAHSGATRDQALRTLTAAWDRIPANTAAGGTGYRIQLAAGRYAEASIPTWWDGRHGNYQYPIVIQAADGPGTATLATMIDMHDLSYVYLLGLRMESRGGDVLHLAASDHMLVRDSELVGIGDLATQDLPQESLKVNQSQYVYVEDSDISGGWGNALDFVGVQYANVIGNKLHRAGDWVAYVKGGSAYIRVEGNEIYDGGNGGFSAGQGTGYEFMVGPWLHYEAYDVKVVNNVIHDTAGAGLGVNGSYNVLLAYNTLYRVGQISHAIEVVHGARSCDGDTARAAENHDAGGWGPTTVGPTEPIPAAHVYIYSNVVYNPAGYQSAWQHFAIAEAATPSSGTNIPNPSRVDVDLQIRGNILWNGPADLPLGIEGGSYSVTEAQLRADNAINTIEPQLVDPAHGDYRPRPGGNVAIASIILPPDFTWTDAPSPPTVPPGALSNAVNIDRAGNARSAVHTPGAYAVAETLATAVGLYDPSTSQFYLRHTTTEGPADNTFGFGAPGAGWLPVAGDWNGDGVDTVGLFDPATSYFYLRNSNDAGAADYAFGFGDPAFSQSGRYVLMMGDWNGDGVDTVGLYDRLSAHWFLRNSNTVGISDVDFGYGAAASTWTPLVGDWNGDGVDTAGFYDVQNAVYYLRNSNSIGMADYTFGYGQPGATWTPIMGDWNGDGAATIGFHDAAAGHWHLRNSNDQGIADVHFGFGAAGQGWLPIVGNWRPLASLLSQELDGLLDVLGLA